MRSGAGGGKKREEELCPRLVDYLVLVGRRQPLPDRLSPSAADPKLDGDEGGGVVGPELLRRYPQKDHKDFPLPAAIVDFCQPEGCIVYGPRKQTYRWICHPRQFEQENADVFFFPAMRHPSFFRSRKRTRQRAALASASISTDRWSGGCVGGARLRNSRRPNRKRSFTRLEKRSLFPAFARSDQVSIAFIFPTDGKTVLVTWAGRHRGRWECLTSLCLVSHHPFFSSFRHVLGLLRRLIAAANERARQTPGAKSPRDGVWAALTGLCQEGNIPTVVLHEIKELETWMMRLLSAPVPVPDRTRVDLTLLPGLEPLILALPDHSRFSLVDFPLHLPLELLGVDAVLRILTCVMLEYKVT